MDGCFSEVNVVTVRQA